jgi:ATP-grasp domain-containing protein
MRPNPCPAVGGAEPKGQRFGVNLLFAALVVVVAGSLVGEPAVRRAFEDVRGRLESEGRLAAMEGVLVQPMVSGGTGGMVGVAQDPLFAVAWAVGASLQRHNGGSQS